MSATKAYALTMKDGAAARLERSLEVKVVTGVNAESVATTTIFTTESDLGSFCVLDAIFVVTTCDAEPDTPQATVSIGAVSAGYADIIPATALQTTYALDRVEILRANEPDTLGIPTANLLVAASTAIKVNVSVAAVTTGSLVYSVYIRGFYLG